MTAATQTLRALYEAFAARDGDAMAAHYAPDATFKDEVFKLSGSDVGDMWRMLTERGTDLRINYTILDDTHVEWTADYTFDGNPVHNEISSAFELDAQGRITKQVDRFDFPKWARQALGWKGKLFASTGFLRTAAQKTAAAGLARWQARRKWRPPG